MRMRSHIFVLSLFLTAVTANANLIVNGSFETPPVSYLYVPGGMSTIPGWQTVYSGVELFDPHIYSAGAAQDGQRILDLNTDFAVGGGIQQTIPTTPGQSYAVSFYGGTWLGAGRNGTGTIEVLVDSASHSFSVANPTPTIVWTPFTFTFQATGSSTTITFQNFEASNTTFALIDNVSVEPVGPADSDGDGVPDPVDHCPNSDLSATVVIDGCDTFVTNTLSADGCTISDQIAACGAQAKNHGQFVSCVSHLTNDLKSAGIITGQQKGAIVSCAAKAAIP